MTRKNLFAVAVAVTAAFCTLAQAEPATYAVDPNHTNVTWEALHMGTSTLRGRFLAKEGTITVDRAAKTGKADVTLDMASLAGPIPHLDNNLRSERGLNIAAFPTARFVSDSFAFDGDKLVGVSGTLTLMGKSQPVNLKTQRFNCYASPSLQGREICGGDFETTISRSAFGMNFAPQVAPDNVRLLIEIEAIKQQ
jgi:polyisoprenoid-binding protein YceI